MNTIITQKNITSNKRKKNASNWKINHSVSIDRRLKQLLDEVKDEYGVDLNKEILHKGVYDILCELKPDEMQETYQREIVEKHRELEEYQAAICSLEEEIKSLKVKITGLDEFRVKRAETLRAIQTQKEVRLRKELTTKLRQVYAQYISLKKTMRTPDQKDKIATTLKSNIEQVITELSDKHNVDLDTVQDIATAIWQNYIIENGSTKIEQTPNPDNNITADAIY